MNRPNTSLNRWTCLVIAAIAFSVVACDRNEPDDAQMARQLDKEAQGHVWRSLLQQLSASTTDDETRVRLLTQFIEKHPDHPDVPDAKRRLALLTEPPEDPAAKLLEKPVQQAIDEGNPQALVALVVATGLQRVSHREAVGELAKPVQLPTPTGMKEISGTYLLNTPMFRWFALHTAKVYTPDAVEGPCAHTCVNDAVGAILAKAVGGQLYVSDGNLNRDVVATLLEQAWIDASDPVLGVTGATLYKVFQPTASAIIRVGQQIEGVAPEAAKQLAALDGPRETSEFYTKFAEEQEISKKLDLPSEVARSTAGWWLRRHIDGTADLFTAFGRKVAEHYEPELLK